MAVGPGSSFPLPALQGLRLASVPAGIRRSGEPDLVLFELGAGSSVAAVFTRNAFRAAPVIVARRHWLADPGAIRYLLINAGNANAGTGEAGLADCLKCCESLAELAGVEAAQVLPFSTGVIGEKLPVARLTLALPELLRKLKAQAWEDAARGIMTTDTRPKGATRSIDADGLRCTVVGIAKGAGMIRPDMATMLAYIVTDAGVAPPLLQRMLEQVVGESFNRISVDGDTSTNDACVLAATGACGAVIDSTSAPAYTALLQALREVAMELAQGLVRDAEGASKFVTVHVAEAADCDEALRVAFTVAESPLVKTALFASDPNWGRILAAVGRAGLEQLSIEKVRIWLGAVKIVDGGAVAPDYREELGQQVMNGEEIEIRIALGRGSDQVTVWTSDLSHDYVRINAEYRT